jgi:hypothetical protein
MEDCRRQFVTYGITDQADNLTPFGAQVLKCAFLPPLFAASVAKFGEANGNDRNAMLFGCLVFYAIEYARELISNPGPHFLGCYCKDSDLVTV